jgi:hypothetical protein
VLGHRLLTAIVLVVTVLWAVNVVIGFVSPSRHDPTINALFATVIGASYALRGTQQPPAGGLRHRLARLIAGDIDAQQEAAPNPTEERALPKQRPPSTPETKP